MLADWRKEEDTEEHRFVVQIAELKVETGSFPHEVESPRKGSHEPKPLKKAGWSIECLKDMFITTKN